MTSEVVPNQTVTKSNSNVKDNKIAGATASSGQHNSWLLRFFESKHFDMSISISYLFNTKEPGVQTYLCNRLFTFPNEDVDFYLPQLLNIYIYCCNETSEQLVADMLNTEKDRAHSYSLAQLCMKQLDKDGNGQISKDEFVAGLLENYSMRILMSPYN